MAFMLHTSAVAASAIICGSSFNSPSKENADMCLLDDRSRTQDYFEGITRGTSVAWMATGNAGIDRLRDSPLSRCKSNE